MLSPLLFVLYFYAITDESSRILIRLENKSDYQLNQVVVTSPASGQIDFGNLLPRRFTDYRRVKAAYPLMAVAAKINDRKVEFVPDDYLGEQLLESGKYTYLISVVESEGVKYLRLKCIVQK